ncbi:hypothetical protein BH23PAT2_BH23PAT2_06450 [soil metagenome]
MTSIIKRISTTAVAAVAAVGLSGGGVIFAQDASVPNQTITANLSQLNDSGATGTAKVQLLDDNKIKVTVNVTGTSPSLPHAQHLHYTVDSKKVDNPDKVDTCPAPSADKNDDGIINTAEGQPSYGEVIVSLTTKEGVGADDGLAVDRFPVADDNGNLNYERTFTLPEGVSREDVTESVVVHHGISELFDDKAKYDGEARSSLDEELPLEATVPAACGKLVSAPVGGAGTGAGSTAETINVPMIAAGSVALVGAGTLLYIGTRKVRS